MKIKKIVSFTIMSIASLFAFVANASASTTYTNNIIPDNSITICNTLFAPGAVITAQDVIDAIANVGGTPCDATKVVVILKSGTNTFYNVGSGVLEKITVGSTLETNIKEYQTNFASTNAGYFTFAKEVGQDGKILSASVALDNIKEILGNTVIIPYGKKLIDLDIDNTIQGVLEQKLIDAKTNVLTITSVFNTENDKTTISFTEIDGTIVMDVKEEVVTSIVLDTTLAKKVYFVGTSFDDTNLYVKTNNGTPITTGIEIKGFASNLPNNNLVITVAAAGKTASYTIKIVNDQPLVDEITTAKSQLLATGNEADYTPESWKAYTAALNTAIANVNNATTVEAVISLYSPAAITAIENLKVTKISANIAQLKGLSKTINDKIDSGTDDADIKEAAENFLAEKLTYDENYAGSLGFADLSLGSLGTINGTNYRLTITFADSSSLDYTFTNMTIIKAKADRALLTSKAGDSNVSPAIPENRSFLDASYATMVAAENAIKALVKNGTKITFAENAWNGYEVEVEIEGLSSVTFEFTNINELNEAWDDAMVAPGLTVLQGNAFATKAAVVIAIKDYIKAFGKDTYQNNTYTWDGNKLTISPNNTDVLPNGTILYFTNVAEINDKNTADYNAIDAKKSDISFITANYTTIAAVQNAIKALATNGSPVTFNWTGNVVAVTVGGTGPITFSPFTNVTELKKIADDTSVGLAKTTLDNSSWATRAIAENQILLTASNQTITSANITWGSGEFSKVAIVKLNNGDYVEIIFGTISEYKQLDDASISLKATDNSFLNRTYNTYADAEKAIKELVQYQSFAPTYSLSTWTFDGTAAKPAWKVTVTGVATGSVEFKFTNITVPVTLDASGSTTGLSMKISGYTISLEGNVATVNASTYNSTHPYTMDTEPVFAAKFYGIFHNSTPKVSLNGKVDFTATNPAYAHLYGGAANIPASVLATKEADNREDFLLVVFSKNASGTKQVRVTTGGKTYIIDYSKVTFSN